MGRCAVSACCSFFRCPPVALLTCFFCAEPGVHLLVPGHLGRA